MTTKNPAQRGQRDGYRPIAARRSGTYRIDLVEPCGGARIVAPAEPTLGELARRRVRCEPADAPWGALSRAISLEDVDLLVAIERGRAWGVLHRAGLITATRHAHEPAFEGLKLKDLVVPAPPCVQEGTSVRDGFARLMADEVHELLVCRGHDVVGTVDEHDLARWVAGERT